LRFMCPSRSAKANHTHMGERYDSNKECSYVTYYDTGNLFGAPMSDSFPCRDLNLKGIYPLESFLQTLGNAEVGARRAPQQFEQSPPCPES
jgi:hypothetical protein